MIDVKAYAYFTDGEGYAVLADLLDWRGMTTAELADVARRYAAGMENYTPPDALPPVEAPSVKERVSRHLAAQIFG